MSKLRKSKTISTAVEGQKKISSFFQTNVGCAGGNWINGGVDKSGLRTENSKTAAGPSLSVKNVSLKKAASFENHQVQSVLASNVANSEDSFSDSGQQLQVGLPKNYLESRSLNENDSLGQDLVAIGTPKQFSISTIDTSDCDIIPDTPEYSLQARNSNKTFGRSFLSSSSVSFVSLGNENGLPKKRVSNPKKSLQKRGHSFESRLKSKSPFNNSDTDLSHVGRYLTEFGEINSRSALSHSDAVSECENISLPFSNNSEQNQKFRRSSGGLSPIPKRQNHRHTPERTQKTDETIFNQDQVTKRLTYQDTYQNADTVAASNSVATKNALSSLRRCNDNTFTGSVSRQKQSQNAVNQSPNLDSDENLSAILNELKADIPLVSSAPKAFSYHLKKQSVSQIKSKEVRGMCANQSLLLDKLCADDMQIAAEIVSSRNDAEEISQQLIIQVDDRRTDHTNLDQNDQISGNHCTETSDILITNEQSLTSTELPHLQNTQFITDDFSQEKEQLNISEVISQQEIMSEGVENLVPSLPSSSANTKDSQSSSGSGGNLCQRFEKLSPFKSSDSSQSQASQILQTIHPPLFHQFNRHKVMSVVKNRNETVVELECAVGSINRVAVLRGFWLDTAVQPGDVMNVIGNFDDTNTCHVTDGENFVVVNPDRLISGTTIVSSLHCMRRSVLNEKFKSSGKSSPFLLYGSIIHTIFQMILVNRMQSKEAIRSAVDTVVQQSAFLHEMYAQGMKEQALRSEIEKYLPQIETFVNSYFRPDNNLTNRFCEQKADIVVTDVRDIEENIWSPRYGLKGKVDLTVNVKIHNRNTKLVEQKVVPLELKTGKTSFSAEHQGQVTLYTMMFADRRTDPEAGLLVYLKDLSMKLIPANYANKRGLIQLRNELAFYLRQNLEKVDHAETMDSFGIDSVPWTIGSLPNPLNSERTCSNCEQLINCSLYQQSIEHRSLNQTMADLVPATLAHLSPSHLGFFSLWCKMLHLEMSLEISRTEGAAALWMHTSQERELKGDCLSELVLVRSKCQTLGAESFVHVFERCATRKSCVPLNDVGILVNDSLLVSSENGTYLALATGIVTSIDEKRVVLTTERDLRKYKECSETIYRLDKCDTFNSMKINLSNLSRLMENTNSSEKLRQLVIERRRPEFNLTLSKSVIQKVRHIMKELNKPQQTAILKVLMAKDYVLIKGYPGTGKTSTIVAIIRILVTCGLSVLLTSYTHSAVDNILVKLIPHKVDFLRIGRLDRIHSSIQPFAAERLTDRLKTVADLTDFYNSKPVVATTCLGINHPVFSQRTFDICIVDEASQVLLPACLGPLYLASRFVLVGDPKQLPPVVQSKEARDLGLGQSLFSVLDEVGGAAYELNLQYRMNSEIMRLSNSLIYEGALQCGSSAVALSRLEITNPSLKGHIGEWQEKCLSAETEFAVMWLNTDSISSLAFQESNSRPSLKSNVEANIVLELVQLFVKVKFLRQKLERSDLIHTEVNTIDQYQGRDKSVIIVSFVKSCMPDSKVSEILKDPRRVNVALTRARHKMIFVGSVNGLVVYEPLQQLLHNILRPNQIYDVTNFAADV